MAQYLIGEVEEMTGVKPYTLRYWESMIPCFSPKKELTGRRVYDSHDINIINRLKYLIYTKGYTIDGARNQIIQEAEVAQTHYEGLQALSDIRLSLTQSLHLIRERNKELQFLQAEEKTQETNERN